MYLDNASTTPLKPEVKEHIISILDIWGNPSSLHSVGRESKKLIKTARENVAKFINANLNESDILFTPSGSASNTLALKALDSYVALYSPSVHKSMMLACQSLEFSEELPVDNEGSIDLKSLDRKLKKWYKPLVCIDGASSEIGTIQDIKAIADITHKNNGVLICDLTGYIPYLPVDVQKLDIDIATFSGHKLGATKGVGVLYKKKNIELKPIVYGTQELGLIGGTENIIGISALGKAVEVHDYDAISHTNANYMLKRLLKADDIYLVGSKENRLPTNLYICFKGVEGESLLLLLDLKDVQVSTGSACNSQSLVPSHILEAINMPKEDIHSCVRITLNGTESEKDLDEACVSILQSVSQLRVLRV